VAAAGASSLPPLPPGFSLRPAGDADRETLFHIYASTREQELAVVDWPVETRQSFLRQQFEAQDQHYRQHYHHTLFDLILLDGEPVGRLYVARWTAEIRIVDIAMLPKARGQGLGTALLTRLLAEADAAGLPVTIHVERENPARRLYARLGFCLAEDKGVYLFLERPPAAQPTPP
jgi:GNAT superfamily N-acetyltransferase